MGGKTREYSGHLGPGLSTFIRLYIYGIHGYVTEVMFTAVWEFVVNTNWKFPGCSSVWSLFIYAICGYGIEKMYLKMDNRVHIAWRGLIYLIWTYSWEFTTGSLLSYFGACPWDYTLFDFNIVGLITLEYAPLWYIGTLIQEQMLTKNILNLRWRDCHHHLTTEENGNDASNDFSQQASRARVNSAMARKHD